MKKLNKTIAVCAASFMLAGGAAVAQSLAPQAQAPAGVGADAGEPQAAAALQELPGEATAVRLCSQCHSFASATQRGHTQDEWNGIIGRMIEQGLTAPEEELMEVSNYLAANHGPPAA